MGLRTFSPASHHPRIFEEVPTYHCSRKRRTNNMKKSHFASSTNAEISLNLINVQFLTNALGNYVWLTEESSNEVNIFLKTQLNKLGKESRISLFKLRLEGENKEYNGALPPSSCK